MKSTAIRTLWRELTAPRSNNPDEALREYMTKVISLLLGLTASLFTFLFFIGWALNSLPSDTIVIMVAITLVFFSGWKLAGTGRWKAAGFLPPLFVFLAAVYGNIIGGAGAPAMVLYAVTIVLTAILHGQRAQWFTVVLCSVSFAVIGMGQINGLIPQLRTPESHFANRVVIVTLSYTTIAAIVWFLVTQYRLALRQSKASSAELEEYSAELSEKNLELETEIGERQRSQELLEKSEEKYRSLVEKTSIGIATATPSGDITYVNEAMHQMLGYRQDEMIGKNFITFLHPDDRERILHEFQIGSKDPRERFEIEFRFMHKNGKVVHIYSTPTAFRYKNAIIGFNAIVLDITERKETEERIRTSLKEKEILLKEIHHRVKNNFQIIISLINLQSNSIKDAFLLKLFNDATRRIRAMALVHEKLYQTGDLSKIDFTSYLKTIVEELQGGFMGGAGRPACTIEADEIHLGIDQAIPCGLIVNELITNALKYAFPNNDDNGVIRICLRHGPGDMISIIVSDNGIGLPAAIDIPAISTLGLQLVNVLVQQIHGTLAIDRSSGTTWTISFPIVNSTL